MISMQYYCLYKCNRFASAIHVYRKCDKAVARLENKTRQEGASHQGGLGSIREKFEIYGYGYVLDSGYNFEHDKQLAFGWLFIIAATPY